MTLLRLPGPDPPRVERSPGDLGRRALTYATGVVGVVALALAAVAAWSLLFADRGEILYLSAEPMPGQSGRIAQHRIVLIHDADALRARVDERTSAIIAPGDRLDELGLDWLSEQYREGIVIVTLDARVGRQGSALAHQSGEPGWYSYVYQACGGTGSGAGGARYQMDLSGNRWADDSTVFNSFRRSLARILEHDDLRC